MGSFNLNNYKYCIELFGYDFMVDDQFRVFLIEVNNNPCICTPGDVLEDMLPRLLEDVMKIGLDPLFPASGDCLNKGRPKVSVTNFVLLHSSSCKATMEMREKQRQDAREARRQEMKAASSPHPNASSPHKPKVPLLKPNNVSTRSSQMLAVDEQLTSPVEPQAEEIIPPHEEDDEVYSDEEKQSDSSAVMDAEDTSNTSRSGGESEMGQDAYIEHTPAGTETIELVCSDKKSPQPSPQLQQQSLPHSQQQIPPAVEQTRSPQVLLHRRVTGAPAERWSELWKTDPSPTFHADKEAVKNAMSQTFNGRLRQKEAWSSRMASQKSSGAQLSRMDLSAGCAFLDSTGSNVVSDLTVSPLRHQVELQSLQHRHFKGKSVGAARRSRHEASQATAGLSQSQLRSPTHPVRSHLPGIGSPPGSQRLSPNTNESMSTPQRMVREAACEAEDVARQLRDAGMINEAAQLERLRVELLQPGADLTAKKNEARSLAERLRTQARERQAGSLRSTDLLMQRNNASKTRRDMFQLHIDAKSEGNRRAASGAQLPAVMGTCALSPTVVNIG